MDILKTLQALNSCHGPSGCEGDVAAAITKLASPFADEITTDTLGNLMVHKKGNGPKIMFSAHMDSIGFIVTHIEKEGFLRVGKVGGIHASDVLATPVRCQNGARGL
ncbi:MAG: M42 family peptidase, partial [Oscillospiraceae bacterium]